MRATNRRWNSVALAALAGLVAGAWMWPQQTVLGGQNLLGCEIDVRSLQNVDFSMNLTGTVYHDGNWKDTGDKEFGTEFTIQVPKDGLVNLGDYLGASPVTTPAKDPSPLERAKEYKVQLYWDEDGKAGPNPLPPGAYIRVLEDGVEVETPMGTRAGGSYDPLGVFHEPVVELVRTNDANPLKKRLRITVQNYGLKMAFTIADD